MPINPVGGYNEVGNRSPFPLKDGKVQVFPGHHAVSASPFSCFRFGLIPNLRQVWAEIAFNSNPTNFTQFNTTSDGKTYKNLIDFNQVDEDRVCWNIDISKLNVPAAVNGTNATILVFYDGGDGALFQVRN